MSSDKFLTSQNGNLKEEQAINVSAGAADADKILRTDAAGEIDESFLPNAEVRTMTAFETVAAGDFIHVRSDGEFEKADATTVGKESHGFVKQAIVAAATGKVYFEGTNTSLLGMTPGAQQFLSTTAGGRTETSPSASGNIVQKIGIALSATEMQFERQQSTELA